MGSLAPGTLRGCSEGAQRVLRGCSEGAPRVLRGCSESAQRVLRECSVGAGDFNHMLSVLLNQIT